MCKVYGYSGYSDVLHLVHSGKAHYWSFHSSHPRWVYENPDFFGTFQSDSDICRMLEDNVIKFPVIDRLTFLLITGRDLNNTVREIKI